MSISTESSLGTSEDLDDLDYGMGESVFKVLDGQLCPPKPLEMVRPKPKKSSDEEGNVLEISLDNFKKILEAGREAIKSEIYPERISQGSSGSYFVKDLTGHTIGVFKPKEEEPYSQMNPKWSKWLHRTCCPCCFGRSCVMVGVGYVSEVAASVVDRFLGLDMVPRTEIVELAAPTFYYTLWDRWKAHKQGKEHAEETSRPYSFFQEKYGSFQVFVNDFRDSGEVFKELAQLPSIPPVLIDAIHGQFERLVVLDYVIRNTDRGLDNLLMRIDWVPSGMTSTQAGFPLMEPVVKMAAIDNGLAFPYKHPDNWRGYPYGWATMEPYIHRPFSPSLTRHLITLLDGREAWDELEEQLRDVFRLDADYRERHFQRQMAVLRGQLRNLLDVLQRGGTPADLLQMPPLLVQEQEEYLRDARRARRIFPPHKPVHGTFDEEDSTVGHPRWLRPILDRPWFINW